MSIPPEWLNTYFRWWGIYTQGDGVGAVGGNGRRGQGRPLLHAAHPRAERLRSPPRSSGRSPTSPSDYGRGIADITVRQNFQLHWVTIEALPDIVRRLAAVGISTLGTCGDVTRNITGCPVAGVDADEIADASTSSTPLTDLLNGNPDFYNLPRKYKVSISGCRVWCTYPEINDVGLTAVRHPGRGEIGFSAARGRRASPPSRTSASGWTPSCRWDQAVDVVDGGVRDLPRQRRAAREPREGAPEVPLPAPRLDGGAFLAELERRLGGAPRARGARGPARRRLPRPRGVFTPRSSRASSMRGWPSPAGGMSPDQMRAVAGPAERFGNGMLRATVMQNLARPQRAARERIGALERALDDGRASRSSASAFLRGTVACTGTRVLQARPRRDEGLRALAGRAPGGPAARLRPAPAHQRHRLPEQLRPALDRRHRPRRQEDQGRRRSSSTPTSSASAAPSGAPSFGRPTGFRVPAPEVPAAIERLLRAYLATGSRRELPPVLRPALRASARRTRCTADEASCDALRRAGGDVRTGPDGEVRAGPARAPSTRLSALERCHRRAHLVRIGLRSLADPRPAWWSAVGTGGRGQGGADCWRPEPG